MDPKKKYQTPEQIKIVFSFPLSAGSATLSPVPASDLSSLRINWNRGGQAELEEITLSYWGDEKWRVLGVRTRRPGETISKEDHFVYDREGFVQAYPKGRYQRINPRYSNTHYRNAQHL